MLDEPSRWTIAWLALAWLASLMWSLVLGGARRRRARARRLRRLLERMGGLWVSFGALLARQVTRFSDEVLEELRDVRHRKVAFGLDEARRIVEAELGAPIARRFTRFDDEPFAVFPFAQVYRAQLIRRDRAWEVVVRVLAPGARGRLGRDLRRIRRVVGALRRLGVLPHNHADDLVGELEAVRNELCDYRYEASHLQRLRRHPRSRHARVMRVFKRWSGRDVLTTEYLDAPSLADLAALRARDPAAAARWLADNAIDPDKVGQRLLRWFLRELLEEDEFDRDLAPRNVVLLRDGDIVLVGTRSVRALHRSFRTTYGMLLRSIAAAQHEKAADCLLLLCEALPPIDLARPRTQIIGELRNHVARADLRPARHDEKSLFHLMARLVRVLERHGIRVGWQVFDVQRGWASLDDSLRELMPTRNLLVELDRYFARAARRRVRGLLDQPATLAAGRVVGTVSELTMFYAAELRRRARVFQATVGKAAYFVATLIAMARWGLLAAGAVVAWLALHGQTPAVLVELAGTAPVRWLRAQPVLAWIALAAGALVVLVGLRRFTRRLLAPEPVDRRR